MNKILRDSDVTSCYRIDSFKGSISFEHHNFKLTGNVELTSLLKTRKSINYHQSEFHENLIIIQFIDTKHEKFDQMESLNLSIQNFTEYFLPKYL